MPKTQVARISKEQYLALQGPVTLPSPQQLFDQIVETLMAKGLAKYEHTDPFRKNLPNGLFLWIPPRPAELDLNYLVSLIEVNGKKGGNQLNPKGLTDKVVVPEGPYLMTDVEDGKGHLNTRRSVSEANILTEHRSPYIVFEGIMHGIVSPEVFASHNMYLCGSRDKSENVPDLYLCDGEPVLGVCLHDYAVPGWGAPSCGSRVGA